MQPKYTKRVSTYADNLYDRDATSYSFSDYKKMLMEHLDKLDRLIKAFETNNPMVDDIRIHISLDAYGDGNLEYDTSLIGDVPMNAAEREKVDEGERNRANNQTRVEKQQLAALLLKYPEMVKK